MEKNQTSGKVVIIGGTSNAIKAITANDLQIIVDDPSVVDFDAIAIEDVNRLAIDLDRTPSQRDYDKAEGMTFHSRRIIRRFKKWNKFIKAAGLKKRRPGVYSPDIPRRKKNALRIRANAKQREKRIERQKKDLIKEGKKLKEECNGKISKSSFARKLGHDYRTIEKWFDGWPNFLQKLA